MLPEVCLVIHPYTARKDVGAGHDRYAYELMANLPRNQMHLSVFDSGELKTAPEAALAELTAILRLLVMKKPQVFHATATLNAMAPITAFRKPLVTTIHDVLWFFVKDNYDSKFKYKVKTAGIRRAANKSDLIIVPFRSTFEFLVNELKVPERRLRLVEYGVDHAQFYPPTETDSPKRPEFFPKEGKTVLFVGAINYGKGVDTLIKSFEQVVRKVPDAKLLIGSKGWNTTEIQDLWKKSGAKDSIHFTGFIPEDQLRAAYIHADLTAFPSRYGFGLSVLESMACGTPTVSGRTLDAPEFVGDAGLMSDPNDPDELAARISEALSNESLYRDLKEKGLKKAAAYRWDATALKTFRTYCELF